MEFMNTAKSGYSEMLSALSKVAAVNVDHLEQISKKQLESVQFYSELGIENMRTLQAINGLESAKALPKTGLETGSKVAKKMLADGKAMLAIGSAYKEAATDIFKDLNGKKSA